MSPSSSRAAASGRFLPTWIQSAPVDLLLFIGVPVLLVPLILARPGRPGVQELILYLGAFGALGHHLPGMLRAYGDRELFRRFRVRFVLAPIFLVGVCVGFSVGGLSGVVLLTFLWTTWHTLMQVYGFARIYDAKVGSLARWTRWLDHALCVAWIGAPIAFSDSRTAYTLEMWYRTGGPLLPAGLLETLRDAWITATLALTAAFVLHLLIAWRRGARPNPVKLVFFGVSFTFWWFCMAAVDHLAVGIALFDVFHDVQYVALVWLFQRSRVRKEGGVTGFTRFLFRRSGGLIGLYVGLIVAYGSLGHFSEGIRSETLRNAMLGVLTASALYHFYLDGFIWKVRERTTREGLGIDGGASAARAARLPSWARHGSKWALFVVPLGWLGYAEATSGHDQGVWRAAVAEAAPRSAEALTAHGVVLGAAGELERALELHRRAIELKPTLAEAHHNLGATLRAQGHLDQAMRSLEQAVRLLPDYARAHAQLGSLLLQLGRPDEAEQRYRAAVRADPHYADPRANLATLRLARGDLAGAVELYRETLAIEPEHRGALNNLAWVQATSARPGVRDPQAALRLAERLDRVTDHRLPQALDTLAAAQAAAGRHADAERTAGEAVELALSSGNPDLAAQIETRRDAYRLGQALSIP